MTKFEFLEATPLIDFVEKNKSKIIGHTLTGFYMDIWPAVGRCQISDMPMIIEMDECCLVVNYLIPSSMEITIAQKDEIEQDEEYIWIMDRRNVIRNFFGEEFGLDKMRGRIEGHIVETIEIKRFSEEFEINGSTGETRPEGGDYFSTIRIILDSGMAICFCGSDAINDGYIEAWLEHIYQVGK
ncbi:MAG: hypothetical protein IKG39_12640 [Lachnospiraceae bacterium]|nr:hypothetical protein [Lachnospiraceae bacterium]